MNDRTTSDADMEKEAVDRLDPSCSCLQDPFSSLPPELHPWPEPKKSGLRKVTCPGCELEFWTNRETDTCIACETST